MDILLRKKKLNYLGLKFTFRAWCLEQTRFREHTFFFIRFREHTYSLWQREFSCFYLKNCLINDFLWFHVQAGLTNGLETDHFILVHGGGFGAWCWYKTMALLSDSGFRVEAVDLIGSGIHASDTNRVKTMAQYVKPLVDLLEKLGDGEKVAFILLTLDGIDIRFRRTSLMPTSKCSRRSFSWDMISAALACRMWWSRIRPRSQKPYLLLRQCLRMARAP